MKKSMQIPRENPDKECDISEFPAPARASDGNFKVLDSPKINPGARRSDIARRAKTLASIRYSGLDENG
jgi:hypothetical protein